MFISVRNFQVPNRKRLFMCLYSFSFPHFPGFAEIIWNYRCSLLLKFFFCILSLLLQKSFLTNCVRICNNCVISNYLDLSLTGFTAHHYFLCITSSPVCIFWSNFHPAGSLPLVMVSEMECGREAFGVLTCPNHHLRLPKRKWFRKVT